ncbi:hypothetical protein ACEWY4_017386 [Coilia grayii]|uniref:Ig-like domain-containing protein n=1 Tax=Coilia grayii TaxID=363190 RepID=A0ABD1JGQ5_9TELE
MRNLTKADAGNYWCAVDKIWWHDTYTDVTVKVTEPGKDGFGQVSGYVGQNITVKCEYEDADKDKRKYMCKNEAEGCKDRIRKDIKDQWVSKGRFSLYDNITGRFFLATISNLTKEDAGIYWCAVDEPVSDDSKVSMDKFNVIRLYVHTGSTVVLSLLVMMVVVVVGTAFVMYIWCKKTKRRARADCVYEEVKDSETNSVYAEAQLPTISCADPAYSTIQFPTSPDGDPAYSTVQSPTSSDGDPTNSVTPVDNSEGVNYASVRFRNNTSDEPVTVSNYDLFCDYANVDCLSNV